MESRCMNNSITDNIVVNSRNNFAFSNAYIGSSQYNSVINNVSYNGMVGFALRMSAVRSSRTTSRLQTA